MQIDVLTETTQDDPIRSQVKSAVARTLIAALASECKASCILSGYEQLPDSFDTDIDFMVGTEEFDRIPALIQHVGQSTGTRLFHTVEHELSGRAFSLGHEHHDQLTVIQPDSAGDYRHFDLLWLRSHEVLSARRWHSRGFWIPAPAHEFAYYLIKRLNKRSFEDKHGTKLHHLYLQDPEGCDQMVDRFWKGRNREELKQMARKNEWDEMERRLESFRAELRRNSAESLPQRIISAPRHLFHHLRRVMHPTGGWVAVMGPDGAGKSAVIGAIRQQFASTYNKVQSFHLRPKFLLRGRDSGAPVTDPHGRPPRGLFASIAKVFFMFADYWLGYLFKIAPAMRRSRFIIFDRYIYDLLVDSKRIRYGGPAWLLDLAARLVPHPDLVILLDAPPDVLWSRKQEVPFEEVARQRQRYLAVAQTLPFAVAVNAAQPLPGVIHDVNAAILERFERRTAQRLNLRLPSARKQRAAVEAPGQQC